MKKITISLSLLLAALAFDSCQKTAINENIKDVTAVSTSAITCTELFVTNAWDSYGSIFKSAMLYTVNDTPTLPKPIKKPLIEIGLIVKDWAESQGGSFDENLVEYWVGEYGSESEGLQWVASSSLSAAAKSYLTNLIQDPKSGSAYTDSDARTYCEYKDVVTTIETDIINDASLSSSEKETLLKCATIARNSAHYLWNLVHDGAAVNTGDFNTMYGSISASVLGYAQSLDMNVSVALGAVFFEEAYCE